MGGTGSVASSPAIQKHAGTKTIEEIVEFVMPLYYTKAALTPEEVDAAGKVWKMVVNNRSAHFDKMKQNDPTIVHANVMEYFYEVFYTRQFDVHPTCKSLFKRPINKQGSFLLRIISLLLAEIEDTEKFHNTLVNLTQLHNKIGVKAVEYGISGEILFYTLRKVLGDVYTPIAHRAWIKIYSRILDHIIPCAVKFEVDNKEMFATIQQHRASVAIGNTEGVFTTHVVSKDTDSRPPVASST